MKNRNILFLAFLFGLNGIVPSSVSYSQTPRQFKRHVEALLDNIQDASCAYAKADAGDTIAYSNLDNANGALSSYLLETLPKLPESLTMKFRDNRIWVTSSPDHKLRSWAWNTWTGGSMPHIAEFVEYKTASGIKVVDPYADEEGGDYGTWIYKIHDIPTASGHTYYLAISGLVGDGMHHGELVDVYEIQDNKLNTKVPLFKTKKKTLSEISYYSDPQSEDRNRFKFSADGRTFLVPLALYKTKEDKVHDVVTMTRKSLKYEFDGEHFVYRGVTK